MIPSVVAGQLRKGLEDYVETTFPFANEPFRSSFKAFVESDKSLCLEPYIAMRLPFESCSAMPTCFEAVEPEHLPYVHQQRAFDRLAGEDGRSTLIATGTGSGKTECFLYPILDYCYRHRGEPGIKALIIYPMNALATDQAGRIARLVSGNAKLRDNVTAGLYVGGFGRGAGAAVMTDDGIITDREAMVERPPDILLTNYKMLDYLLMRPHDSRIWRDNKPDTLKYVAVDELHTFDGAQGTDLACLLRRLKSKLYIQSGHLCCVGTSATMGGDDAVAGMIAYASDLFGEPFDADAVIRESRQSVEDFLSGADPVYFSLPDADCLCALREAQMSNDQIGYLKLALQGFIEDYSGEDPLDAAFRLELAEKIKRCALFQSIMEYAEGSYYRVSELSEALGKRYPELVEEGADAIVYALVALVSHARTGAVGRLRPFLGVQVQLWSKELRRLVASVGAGKVDFDIAINLSSDQGGRFLPVVNCRDCGQTAWAGLATQDQFVRVRSLDAFYSVYFGSGENLVAVYPREAGQPAFGDAFAGWYCPDCGKFLIDAEGRLPAWQCSECQADSIPVSFAELVFSGRSGSSRSRSRQYCCPCCGSEQGMSIMGMQATTESEVFLTQLFASGFDQDDRSLVFSDNVQDASHRAGFFNGRTWKFGLRSALLECLRGMGGRVSIADLQSGFAAYWRERMGDEDFVARFIAPNNIWMREYEKMVDEGRLSGTDETDKLLKSISDRMSYEALLEVGIRSHVGRTLEKSGALAVGFDHVKLERAASEAEKLVFDEEGIRIEDDAQLGQLVLALLEKLRFKGAFDDPLFREYIANGARTWYLSHRYKPFMPGEHASGVPTFLLVSDASTKKRFLTFHSAELVSLAQSLMPDICGADASLGARIMRCVARACESQGLLAKALPDSRYCSYAIKREAAFVTVDTVRLTCDTCGRSVARADENLGLAEGSRCPSPFCPGHLDKSPSQGLDYYGHLFAAGLKTRIRASEHTGLLHRGDRERVEREFKANGPDRRSWYPNVLSCTPTLEMGIDIGSLSSLVMCGMPPGQAQFLQRTGRAGRRDGNALALVVANANPHGMYFYDEPREMLDGNVEAPRVFLEASAVLERQFIAYCLDRWTLEAGDENCVPDKMFKCLQAMLDPSRNESKFPFTFLSYVKTRVHQLTNSFLRMFSGDFPPDSDVANVLRTFALGGAGFGESRMHVKVFEAFESRMRLREFYKRQKGIVDEVIAELKAHPADSSYEEKIKEQEIEKRAIGNVIKAINNENVFGFMSRVSLLPNYAFPEEGANLRVVLRRRTEGQGEKTRWERETQEFSRAAASAISEFAPGNTFYANGHHYEIEQIDLSSAKEEEWRLCPDCSHAERVTPSTPAAACPKCHSTAWADNAQRRKMLKLATVVSNGDYSETMSDDSSDRRSVEFFSKQLLVEVDSTKDVERAYKVNSDDVDFGFEYAKRATLREINYGPVSSGTSQESTIAGETAARTGFRVCMKCGRVQREGKEEHAKYCPVERGKASSAEAIEECLFLYREFETEAVRILIPETSVVDIERGITESFTAAVMLGLKKKFGNVDHLCTTVCEEPVPESGFRKRYLVVYDSIPGGTGYLKQLVGNGGEFMSVLRMALDAMEACPCKDDPHRDGCYRCLYAYRQSRDIGSISRKRAIAVLREILACETLEDVRCLDDVPVNNLFDSALEEMFVDALSGAMGPDGAHVGCEREVVHGKPGYRLKVGDFTWEVEPQVDLGPAQGVDVMCRPDFVLWPIGLAADDTRRPVAVFTDGFEFHKNRLADDAVKRESIRRSGGCRVWSLSYKDVESAVHADSIDYYLNIMRVPELPHEELYEAAIAKGSEGLQPEKESPFDLLIWYLGHSNAEKELALHADAYSLGMMGVLNPVRDSERYSAVSASCIELADALHLPYAELGSEEAFIGIWRPGEAEFVQILSAATESDASDYHATCMFVSLDDSDPDDVAFRPQWNGCLSLANLMQFFPGFAVVPSSALKDGVFEKLPEKIRFSTGTVPDKPSPDSAWEEVFGELFEPSLDYAERLAKLGVAVPDEVGYELETGEQAELAWTGDKICFLPNDLIEDKPTFEKVGWTVLEESTDDEAILEVFGVDR